MPQLLYLGLLLALFESPLLMTVFTRLRFNPFLPVPRSSLWVAAAVVIVIAATNIDDWRISLGLTWLT